MRLGAAAGEGGVMVGVVGVVVLGGWVDEMGGGWLMVVDGPRAEVESNG